MLYSITLFIFHSHSFSLSPFLSLALSLSLSLCSATWSLILPHFVSPPFTYILRDYNDYISFYLSLFLTLFLSPSFCLSLSLSLSLTHPCSPVVWVRARVSNWVSIWCPAKNGTEVPFI